MCFIVLFLVVRRGLIKLLIVQARTKLMILLLETSGIHRIYLNNLETKEVGLPYHLRGAWKPQEALCLQTFQIC